MGLSSIVPQVPESLKKAWEYVTSPGKAAHLEKELGQPPVLQTYEQVKGGVPLAPMVEQALAGSPDDPSRWVLNTVEDLGLVSARTLQGLTTPSNLALIALMATGNEEASLPLLARIGFTGAMASQAIKDVAAGAQAARQGNLREAGRLFGSAGVNSLFALLANATRRTPKGTTAPEVKALEPPTVEVKAEKAAPIKTEPAPTKTKEAVPAPPEVGEILQSEPAVAPPPPNAPDARVDRETRMEVNDFMRLTPGVTREEALAAVREARAEQAKLAEGTGKRQLADPPRLPEGGELAPPRTVPPPPARTRAEFTLAPPEVAAHYRPTRPVPEAGWKMSLGSRPGPDARKFAEKHAPTWDRYRLVPDPADKSRYYISYQPKETPQVLPSVPVKSSQISEKKILSRSEMLETAQRLRSQVLSGEIPKGEPSRQAISIAKGIEKSVEESKEASVSVLADTLKALDIPAKEAKEKARAAVNDHPDITDILELTRISLTPTSKMVTVTDYSTKPSGMGKSAKDQGIASPGENVPPRAVPEEKAAGSPASAAVAPQKIESPAEKPAPPVNLEPWTAENTVSRLRAGEQPPYGQIYALNRTDIDSRPALMQFRTELGKIGRAVSRGKIKTYNPLYADRLLVWYNPKSEEILVVDGHHRHEIAAQTKQPTERAEFIRADSVQQARAVGALKNIAEGNATPVDAAKFFRDSGLGPEYLAGEGIALSSAVTRDGMALANLAEPLFDKVATGKLPEYMGVAIGANLADPVEQQGLLDLIKRTQKSGRTLSRNEIAALARRVKMAGKTSTEAGGLFGGQEEQSNAVEAAALESYLRERLSHDRRLFGFVSKEARAQELGRAGNIIDVGRSRDIAGQSALMEDVFDRLVGKAGPVEEVIADGAARIKSGEDPEVVRKESYSRIAEAVRAALGGGEAGGGE